MKEINTGGPAFPGEWRKYNNQPGMSLRDWFAGMAMQGALANPDTPIANMRIYALCENAYEIADAMISQRAKKEAN